MKTTTIRQVRRRAGDPSMWFWELTVDGRKIRDDRGNLQWAISEDWRGRFGLQPDRERYAPGEGFELRVTAKLIKPKRARRAGGRKA